MVRASQGRGDNGTETSLNNSCSSRHALTDYMRVFIRKERRERRFESSWVFLSIEGSARPACCGFIWCLSPRLRGPEKGDKQNEEHRCLSPGQAWAT